MAERHVEGEADAEGAGGHSVMISSARRSMASATAPPNTDTASSGPSWARLTNPTSSDECVRRNTSNGVATMVSCEPMVDTRSTEATAAGTGETV